MFEDAKRRAEGYQQDLLREFLAIIAPPANSAYDKYAHQILGNGSAKVAGQARTVGRIGADSFGPYDMDVSAIVGLLVDRDRTEERKTLCIPSLHPKIRQELYNIRGDRNDLEAHFGASTDLSSLGACFVISEHLIRFCLALCEEPPDVQTPDKLVDCRDRWFSTIRRFIANLGQELSEYETEKAQERKVNELISLIISRTVEEREEEYTKIWRELRRAMSRTDDYGHPRSDEDVAEARKMLNLFDLKAAEAGVERALQNVRDTIVYGGMSYSNSSDYASRASTLVRLTRNTGLTIDERLWLAGVYESGLLPTHSPEEGTQMLEDCKLELGDNKQIVPYKRDGFTFYRIGKKQANEAAS